MFWWFLFTIILGLITFCFWHWKREMSGVTLGWKKSVLSQNTLLKPSHWWCTQWIQFTFPKYIFQVLKWKRMFPCWSQFLLILLDIFSWLNLDELKISKRNRKNTMASKREKFLSQKSYLDVDTCLTFL